MLKLENVEKHYKQFNLKCSLTVKPGCVTGLIGQNGSGKTTTFKCILNLIQTESGTIEIFGKAANLLTNADREKLGVVLADAGFSGYMTVGDVAAVLKGMYRDFKIDDFYGQCRRFQIPMNKKIKEFSTGTKAKLKLLIAMSHQAQLLILDEPTAGLDVIARTELLDMLRGYMESGENSILISSHISGDLQGFCDDIYMIDNGEIILHEDTDVLLDSYGILKVTEEQYAQLEKQYILRRKQETFGYSCLTKEKQFYAENYPQIAIENGNIDDIITIMAKGARIC